MSKYEIHYAGEWAALYVDGVLDPKTVGDTHIAEERALKVLGVKQVFDEAFMRGQNERDGVAKDLQEVEEYKTARDARRVEAERLRTEASKLIEKAKELEAND